MNNSTLLAGIMSFIAGAMTMKAVLIVKNSKQEYDEIENSNER